jgi:hypothetical protein
LSPVTAGGERCDARVSLLLVAYAPQSRAALHAILPFPADAVNRHRAGGADESLSRKRPG